MLNKKQILKLKGATMICIDWANVYGWRKSLKQELCPQKLFDYLVDYDEIGSVNFYYGKDDHEKSHDFLTRIKNIEFNVKTKPVKHIKIEGTNITQRKCDFDLEIGLDCFERLHRFDSFVFFSGDGDFATLYERLIKKGKQVIVIYTKGHLGKEIWNMKKGIFKTEARKMPILK